ncbi:MAG: molybdopterin-dependent oxidoreductase [Nitrososphaerales archaeon]
MLTTQRIKRSSSSFLRPFLRGAAAGVVALLFNFFLRMGSLAPFPPESAIESFLKVIPESIQEPAVQKFGDLAGQLGLVAASVIAVVVYGILGIIYDRKISSSMKSLSRLEGFLSYSLIPWILFGVILLPVFGVSFFGIASIFATSDSVWLFPISFLFVQLMYSFPFYYLSKEKQRTFGASSRPANSRARNSTSRWVSRRSFVEKGLLGAGVLALTLTSLDKILSAANSSAPASVTTPSAPINLIGAPAIFQDPRLVSLVDFELTPNDSFYRVAIDLFDPAVDASSWALRVAGLVGTAKSYGLTSFESVFEPVDQYNTFECVSNVINGNLIGNAKWTGVKISDIIKDAGGSTFGARYVVFYSIDGYSVAIPLSKAMMSDSILAYKMNDETLPQKHGYPLRAVIPGLYGMMSAKWINKIDLVDSHYEGYWQTRGWSDVGTVQTVAFVSIPGNETGVSLSKYSGSVILGGIAYAGDRGISKVEVSTDQGKTWSQTQLKNPLANTSWSLWAYDWRPSSTGTYNVYVRATDGTGATQTSNQTNTFPSGATGYGMMNVNVGS